MRTTDCGDFNWNGSFLIMVVIVLESEDTGLLATCTIKPSQPHGAPQAPRIPIGRSPTRWCGPRPWGGCRAHGPPRASLGKAGTREAAQFPTRTCARRPHATGPWAPACPGSTQVENLLCQTAVRILPCSTETQMSVRKQHCRRGVLFSTRALSAQKFMATSS